MILSINTTASPFGAALMGKEGDLLAEFSLSPGAGHFSRFVPAIDFLFKASNADVHELRALVAATGPGSFTGLRAGLSVAKGFCRALQIPIIGISSLEAMASQATGGDCPICALINSRRDEVFASLFQRGPGQGLVRVKGDACLAIFDLASFIEGPALFLGNDYNRQAPRLAAALGTRAVLAPRTLWNLRASSVGSLGLERFHNHDFDELQDFVPVYLRPPDIKPNSFPLLQKMGDPVPEKP